MEKATVLVHRNCRRMEILLPGEVVPEPGVPPYSDNARIHLDLALFESASFARERRLSMYFTLPRHPFGMSISCFGQNEQKR